jgi:hypothetical protein
MTEKDTELKTEEVNELLRQVPGWVVRWGTSVIFVLIIIIFASSLFTDYSESVTAKALIIPADTPVHTDSAAGKNCFTVRLLIPVQSIRKIKAGQKVIITFDENKTPCSMSGSVNDSSLFSSGMYTASVCLQADEPLKAEDAYKAGNPGTARIITKEQTLFNKIFYRPGKK